MGNGLFLYLLVVFLVVGDLRLCPTDFNFLEWGFFEL